MPSPRYFDLHIILLSPIHIPNAASKKYVNILSQVFRNSVLLQQKTLSPYQEVINVLGWQEAMAHFYKLLKIRTIKTRVQILIDILI